MCSEALEMRKIKSLSLVIAVLLAVYAMFLENGRDSKPHIDAKDEIQQEQVLVTVPAGESLEPPTKFKARIRPIKSVDRSPEIG